MVHSLAGGRRPKRRLHSVLQPPNALNGRSGLSVSNPHGMRSARPTPPAGEVAGMSRSPQMGRQGAGCRSDLHVAPERDPGTGRPGTPKPATGRQGDRGPRAQPNQSRWTRFHREALRRNSTASVFLRAAPACEPCKPVSAAIQGNKPRESADYHWAA